MVRALADQAKQNLQSGRPGKKRGGWLIFPHIVLQGLFFVVGNIRRIAGDDVETVVPDRTKQISGLETDAIKDVMAFRVFAGD